VLALLAVRLVDEFAGFLPNGAFESFRSDLGLSYTQASAVLVVAGPGAIVGNVFAVLADYRSRRVIAAGGAFGFAAALAVFGLAPTFPLLLVAAFGLGCASTAMCDATEIALVGIAGDDSATQMSRSFLFGAAGDLLGPFLLIAVATGGLSWRAAFAFGALTAAAYAVWLTMLPFPPPPTRAPDHSARAGLGPIIRDRRVWYFGVLALLLGPLDEDALAFLIAYLERDIALTTASATSIAMASVVGAIVGFVSTGRRGYRPPAHALRNQAAIFTAATIAAVAFRSIPMIIAAEFVFGIAVARYWIALKTRIVRLYPDRVGSMNAVVSTIEFSGFLLPLFTGWLADTFGVRAGFGFSAAIAVLTLALILTYDGHARARGRDQASKERAI
jgi:predicted MFS family arabinose efflux permease